MRDRLVADFVGLPFAFGGYRRPGDPLPRTGGISSAARRPRLFIYCSLSGGDRHGRGLAVAAIRNAAGIGARWGDAVVQDLSALATLTYGLSALTLEDLASSELPWLLEEALEQRR